MTVEMRPENSGVDVHLDPMECEAFMRVARDAARASYVPGGTSYFSVCVSLGQQLNSMLARQSGSAEESSLALSDRMVALILGDDAFSK